MTLNGGPSCETILKKKKKKKKKHEMSVLGGVMRLFRIHASIFSFLSFSKWNIFFKQRRYFPINVGNL